MLFNFFLCLCLTYFIMASLKYSYSSALATSLALNQIELLLSIKKCMFNFNLMNNVL